MKKYFLLIFTAMMLVSVASNAQFYRPESIISVPGEPSILVANVQNGTIVKVSLMDNAVSDWAKGLNGPKGMAILDGKLYSADVNVIRCFNLKDAALLNTYPVPGSVFLNDTATDGHFIYVTDMETNKLIKLNPETGEVSEFITEGLNKPNGICYWGEMNSLLLVSYGENSSINRIDLKTGEISIVAETGESSLDGIALTRKGKILFSSWETGAVYLFDYKYDDKRILKNGFSGPADFWLDEEAGKIYLPIMMENKISRIPFSD